MRPNTTSTQAPSGVSATGETVPLARTDAAPARPGRSTRRVISRAPAAPIDRTADYRAVGQDLRWILIWSILLFAAMIALRFSGLVAV